MYCETYLSVCLTSGLKVVTGGEYEESFSGLGGLLGVNLIKHVKTQGVKA